MTEHEATRVERKGRSAWITLDSPGNRNALSESMVAELGAHLREAEDDPEVRVIVLTGAGPAFCAGADLKNRGNAMSAGGGDTGTANPFVAILRRISNASKPVIVAVNGHAFGGGIGLVAAADIAIAVDSAKFSFSEVRVGVIPAMISVVVLPKIGVHNAMRLFLTAERFDAVQAQRYGLLHRVVPVDGLMAAVEEEIDAISLGGPIAVEEAKRLVRTVSRLPEDEAFRYAEETISRLFSSPEAAEGMTAFIGKRRPSWVG